jgi:biotin synthase
VKVRNDWTLAEVQELFALPFMDLMFMAQTEHRRFQTPNSVQVSTLLSIKTGACPEDCAYCPQSVRFDTGLETQELLEVGEVAARARAAKESGATRFCMGAAYRSPKQKDLRKVLAMIREVKSLGMETCATLGMLTPASTTTITISIPRRGTTGKSSARAPIRIDSTLCKPCATPG